MNNFVTRYFDEEKMLINNFDTNEFSKVVNILIEAYKQDKQIFIMGNGGSAATANHFAGDCSKNAITEKGKRHFRMISLSDSAEKVTMYGNDFAFEEIFSQQLENLMNNEDVLISISASGNSPNLIRACEFAKTKQAKIISMNGFTGGKVKAFADVSLIVNTDSYERIEDMHMIFCHMLVCYFKDHPEVLI